MLRIAINGFGRIGRLSLRAALETGQKMSAVSRSMISAALKSTRICSDMIQPMALCPFRLNKKATSFMSPDIK